MPFDARSDVLANKILTTLPAADLERIKPKLERFEMVFGATLNTPNQIAEHIYFPDSGMISLLGTLGEGSNLEISIVASEGAIPLCPFLGTPSSPVRALVQGHGIAHRIKTADFLDECRASPELTRMLLHFTRSLMLQISQCAVCFRFHMIEERLARWLLMSADRMESNEFLMTQKTLSSMLGVRREGVTKAASHLQKLGIIQYSRGKIHILDRPQLEGAACACYAILSAETQ